ncbi:MAG: hypothetical protein L0287_23905, partial [Anaerolineae bacterium]|nr:hypothetical protein [Anaerolineae bacterium]
IVLRGGLTSWRPVMVSHGTVTHVYAKAKTLTLGTLSCSVATMVGWYVCITGLSVIKITSG